MKFVLEFTRHVGSRPADNIEAGQLVLKAFAGWNVPDGLTINEFTVRVDGRGGVIVCVTDDYAVIYSFVAQYAGWFDWNVWPVLDVVDAAEPYGTGLAWAKAAIA